MYTHEAVKTLTRARTGIEAKKYVEDCNTQKTKKKKLMVWTSLNDRCRV